MLLVLEREFVTRVRSRSFLLSTLLVPLFMVLVFAVPILMQVTGSGGEQRIVVVDEGPPAVGEQVVRSLSAVPTRERDTRFAVEHLRVPLASVRDSLNAAIRVESVDGYLWIPPGVVEQSGAAYRARNVTDFEIQERLSAAVSEAVQAVRLAEAGLQISEVASLRPRR
jgi:ABC-2 type transport system permease protein